MDDRSGEAAMTSDERASTAEGPNAVKAKESGEAEHRSAGKDWPLIVLRFRDIEVNLGDTIRQHRLVLNSHGVCWWGWLYREYERNPREALGRAIVGRPTPF